MKRDISEIEDFVVYSDGRLVTTSDSAEKAQITLIKRAMEHKGGAREQFSIRLGLLKNLVGSEYQFHDAFSEDDMIVYRHIHQPEGVTVIVNSNDDDCQRKFFPFDQVSRSMILVLMRLPKFLDHCNWRDDKPRSIPPNVVHQIDSPGQPF